MLKAQCDEYGVALTQKCFCVT